MYVCFNFFSLFLWAPIEEMDENKGDTTKKQPQQHLSNSPADPHDQDSPDNTILQQQQQQQQPQSVVSGAPYISSTLYNIPGGAATTSVSFEQQQQFEVVNTKRPRYTASQWKFIPSSAQQQHHQQQKTSMLSAESSPISPSAHTIATNPQTQQAASSSDTASSPSHSPRPSSASGQEPSKSEGGEQVHQQFRKGKYVSPVWKPNEMLWLARAWKIQYQGGGGSSSELGNLEGSPGIAGSGTAAAGRGKTRADKDREVAEFLNRHGVNRDAKTAGTKWDNMLGEFRKVYEWERGAEREQIGKSYFRLSPYERKIHRLPASFDEEVFEELSQFMGPRMRTPQTRIGTQPNISDDIRTPPTVTKSLPPPPPFREDELPLSGTHKNNNYVFNFSCF